jgi:hypothetical protein
MSTGSVSDSSSDDSTDSDSSSNSTIGIKHLLIDAIRAGELDTIRVILSQEHDEDGLPEATDDDIHKALEEGGSVEACRLLWERLTSSEKEMYFAEEIDAIGPLHWAANYGHLHVVRLFVKEFNWNINQLKCRLQYTFV